MARIISRKQSDHVFIQNDQFVVEHEGIYYLFSYARGMINELMVFPCTSEGKITDYTGIECYSSCTRIEDAIRLFFGLPNLTISEIYCSDSGEE